MSCVVIFGGAGFVGASFAEKLLSNPSIKHIYQFDLKSINSTSAYIRNLLKNNTKIKYISGDVRKPIPSFTAGQQVLFIANFAAIHREPGHQPNEYFDTNMLGAQNVCDFAERVNCKKIIFTSSISPYGIEDKLKDEGTIPCPNTAYGSSKLVAEKIHMAWQNRDINNRILTIVRPGVVFGKGEGGNMSRLVKLIHKNFFFYMGNKKTQKAGIYVKELVNQIMWVHDGQINNKFPKITLFNATMWPNPSIEDYVQSIASVSSLNRFFVSLPFSLLNSIGYILGLFFWLAGKKNLFSPIRLRKLVRSNLVRPSFLLMHSYKFTYTLRSALEDWKQEDPDIWS